MQLAVAEYDAGNVSATSPDWSREQVRRFWDPSRRLLRCVRRYQAHAKRRGPLGRIRRAWCVLAWRFWSAVTGAEIHLTTAIGGGLLLPHPNGIVIHPDVEIGPNCLLFQQVTLGTAGRRAGVPKLGGHVDVGAGAKILGGITVGDHASIGANAVVLDDVPPGAVVVGVPARIVRVADWATSEVDIQGRAPKNTAEPGPRGTLV